MQERSRKIWSNALRILLSLGTLALLLVTVGWREILEVLAQADWPPLLLAGGLFFLGVVVRTLRWQALLMGLGLQLPLRRLLRLYLVGGFFNVFLPTGFGGDVVRVVELAQGADRTAAAGTVFVDRLTGILSLMAMGLIVLPFTPRLEPWLIVTVILICGSGLLGGFLLLEGRWIRRLTRRLPHSLSLAGEGALARLYASVTGAGRSALWQALALSTLFNLLNVMVYWLCGRAVGIEVGPAFYFVVVPLLSLTLLAPISVGGLGVRDWVAQPLFASVNIAARQAAGMTLAAYAVTAVVGLIGGVLYLGAVVRDLAGRRATDRAA
ncbi:MAG: lysylphosphatidylglycerol synthase transmembrane domain-containing protein [Anaerolineales bacterium]